jgi:hypothetical protein
MPKIIGQLLDIEQVPPYIDRKTGVQEREGFPRLHVLEGRAVHQINVDARKYVGPSPTIGTVIEAEVEIRSYVSRGNAQMVFDLLRFEERKPAAHKQAA